MTIEIAPLGDGDVHPVAVAIAAWQADPTHHVCYVGDEALAVAEELAAEPRWRERLLVAREHGDVVGAVLASVDEEMGRVWWFGPWGTTSDVRTAVLTAAAAVVGDDVTEVEFGPDERNRSVAALAAAVGCERRTASSVLVLDPLVVPARPAWADLVIEPLERPDPVVAALHDELFPGTHTTGATLVDAPRTTVLVARDGGDVVGYVAGEVDPDGSGYLDYVGVAPTARRRGIASALIAAQLAHWHDAGLGRAFLTVREDAVGARALYLGLGFVEERVVVPWRRGFDLG